MSDLLSPDRIAIRVDGLPIPQGSKTVVPAKGKRRAFVRDANADRLHPWRTRVTAAARDHCRDFTTLTGPIRIWVRFTFERPAAHYGSGSNSHRLKPDAPTWPTKKTVGDIDKLQRAIFDALTDANVWHDDSQVVDVRARKFYAGEHELALPAAGVVILLEEIS